MDTENSSKYSDYLYALPAMLFAALYLLLSYYNRFSFEDYYYIETLREKEDVFSTIRFYYNSWHGRWMALLGFYLWFGFTDVFNTLNLLVFLQHLFVFATFVMALQEVFRFLFSILGVNTISFVKRCILATLTLSAIYFASFSIIESWWWLCSTFFHLYGIMFFLLGLASIFGSWKGVISTPISIICGAYIGASNELLSIILITSSLVFSFISLRRGILNVNSLFRSKEFKRFLIFILPLIVFFISDLISPGMSFRKEVMNELYTNHTNINGFKFSFYDSEGALNLFFHYRYSLTLAIIASLAIYFNIREGIKIEAKKFRLTLLFTFILTGTAFLVTTLVNIYIFKNNLGPLRAWISFSSFFVLFLIVLTIKMFNRYKLSKRIKRSLPIVMAIPIAVLLLIIIWKQYPMVSNYANVYDKRYSVLWNNDSISTKELNRLLPPTTSGMLLQTNLKREEFEKAGLFKSD